MHFSLVIPAYNEEAKITRDIDAANQFLKNQPFTSEVLIVSDGSRDRTKEVAEAHSAPLNSDKVKYRIFGYPQNRGKGYAVRFGVERAEGEIIAFADAGLCVPFKFLSRGITAIEKGADYAVASRRLAETKILLAQPLHRRLGSKAFWFVIRGFMGVDTSDTQCGFKVYSAEAAKAIYSRVKTDGFMFDVEALLVGKKLGLKEAEFSVEWSNDSDSRYHPVWGTLRNFKELVKIRLRSFEKYA